MNDLDYYAENKIKVRVTFESGKTKWGWIHLYNNRYWLTRGNREIAILNAGQDMSWLIPTEGEMK